MQAIANRAGANFTRHIVPGANSCERYNGVSVPVPPIPAPFDQLRGCPFSFYPPIANVEHNEWIFRGATWDEIRVVNTKTAGEVLVPRRFLGAVSLVGEPVVIVGLLKELEYKEGAVLPLVRRVIEMPRAVNESPRPRIQAPRPRRSRRWSRSGSNPPSRRRGWCWARSPSDC